MVHEKQRQLAYELFVKEKHHLQNIRAQNKNRNMIKFLFMIKITEMLQRTKNT